MARYIRKEKRYSHIYKSIVLPIYRNTMGWGKPKKRNGFYIYKRNTNNLGKTNSYPMYIGKIHKKKRLSSIYIVKHIFFWRKGLISIYII